MVKGAQLRALISRHHIAPVFSSFPTLSATLDMMWNYIKPHFQFPHSTSVNLKPQTWTTLDKMAPHILYQQHSGYGKDSTPKQALSSHICCWYGFVDMLSVMEIQKIVYHCSFLFLIENAGQFVSRSREIQQFAYRFGVHFIYQYNRLRYFPFLFVQQHILSQFPLSTYFGKAIG